MTADELLAELGRGLEPPAPSSVAVGPETEEALERVGALADAFERHSCSNTQVELLGLQAVIASALGRDEEAAYARSRREYLAAMRAYVEGDVLHAAQLMRGAETAYRELGHGLRRFHAESMVVRFTLESAVDDPDEALDAAVMALAGLRPAEDGEEVLEYARRLAADIAGAPVREASARFFARCAEIAAEAEAVPLKLSMQVRLGGALVALGLPELGLELLLDAGGELRRYGAPDASGQTQPLDETAEGLYWVARAYDRIGRTEDAERAYRGHPARAAGGIYTAEIATRLAELVADQGRLEEAVAILEPLPGAKLPAEYKGLAAALEARIQAQLGRPAAGDARAAEAVAALARVGPAPGRVALPTEEELQHTALRADSRQQVAAMIAARRPGPASDPGLHAAGRGAEARARLALAQHALAEPADEPTAERHLDAARAVLEALGGDAGGFRFERVKAALHAARGDHRSAVDMLEAAVEAELGIPDIDLTGIVERPVPAAALAVEMRAMRAARGVGVDARCRLAAERVAAGAGDGDELDVAIAAAAERNRHGAQCDVLVAKASWLTASGRVDEAVPYLRTAVDVIEGMRALLSDSELQVTALADRETVYGLLLQAGMAAGEPPEDLVATMERAKGRALLNALPAEDRPASRPERLLLVGRRERHELLQELRRRFAEHDSDPARLEVARARLAAAYREFHRPSAGVPRAAASVAALEELGADGTVLVHYFLVGGRFVAGVVAEGAVRPLVPLDDCSRDAVVGLLEGFAFERDVLGPVRSLEELHRLLIAPLEPVLERAEQLLVIPHDVLHGVPFHALVDSAGHSLIERLPVRYAPSGAIALRARARVARRDSDAASAGFAVDAVPYISLAPIGAVAELAAVAAAVPQLETHAGPDAVRARLLGRTGTVDVLHLACHGEFDPTDPLLSRLYLADGPVYGYEILSLATQARMVVLSACESGIQARLPGDEHYGLVRAYLAGGAVGVVSTLWAVPDESSGRLMEAFYRHWREEHAPPADALRAAQLELARSDAYDHPRYWAPYMLIGE